MLSSLLSSLVWGAQEEATAAQEEEIEHSTSEETGDWLVITASGQGEGNASSSASVSECDHESICSESSWIITPGPTFRRTGQHASTNTTHPLENLLIEHPTMSVYGEVPGQSRSQSREDGRTNERSKREERREGALGEIQGEAEVSDRERELERAQAQEMVLLRNRQRYQVAVHMQIPQENSPADAAENVSSTSKAPLRVTRKESKRLNKIKQRRGRGKQVYQIKKCSFVAGRRRC